VSFRSINEDNVLAALANVLYAGSATTKRRLAAKVEREKGLLVRYGGGRSISHGLPRLLGLRKIQNRKMLAMLEADRVFP